MIIEDDKVIAEELYNLLKSLNYEAIILTDFKNAKNEILKDENVWLTQKSMAELFNTTRNNITMYLKNIP